MTTSAFDLHYAPCDCHIWTLVRYMPVGRCGRCRTRPEGSFQTKAEAFDFYYALHGKVPERMSA